LSPLELRLDTRTPYVSLRWVSIGKAIIAYDNDRWLLKVRILFFSKKWELEKLILKATAKKRTRKIKQKRKRKRNKWLKKMMSAAKTFRITKWQIAVDTGDSVKNAWLYALNFYPHTYHHLYINFVDENYLLLEFRNVPWKLAYAFMR
jgi:hypothetical protein